MKWPELTRNNILAGAFALFVLLSAAALHAAPLGLGPLMTGSDATADVGDTTDPASPNVTRQPNRTVTLDCSTIADRQPDPASRSSANAPNPSRSALPAGHVLSTLGNGTSPADRAKAVTGNGTVSAIETQRVVPTNVRETCRLLERYSPPEWMTEMAATWESTDSGPVTDGASTSYKAYSNTSARAQSQLALAHSLRDILTDESRARRESTFVAAELALAERRGMANGSPNNSVQHQLATQQTKLWGARNLLTSAETGSPDRTHSLPKTTRLTETAVRVQVSRLKTETHPTDPTDVKLPTITTPDHVNPTSSTVAILKAHDTELTDKRSAEIRDLNGVPDPIRRELTAVLNAYLVYQRTVQESNGADVRRVRAAQVQLQEATADLEAVLADANASEGGGSVSQGPARPTVQIDGVLSIDLSSNDSSYTEDYKLQIDAGGDDTYNNNAGGANATGNSTDAAALIDLGGTDTYNGRNGGGRYVVTNESPSVPDPGVPLPKKGEAAGFLLDAGTGDDTYNAEAHGSNGGGRRAIGFLVDAGGDDTYIGNGTGTNGAGSKNGTGYLLDAGNGTDTYAAGDDGVSNGGAQRGHGFLFDVGGNDNYAGWNGGAKRQVVNNRQPDASRQCVKILSEGNISDKPCKTLFQFDVPIPNPQRPSGGFLVDGGGTDTYDGANTGRVASSNGGAGIRAAGFLLDAGTGNDTYDGRNGGADRKATGFLLDAGGSDTYESGNGGQNGGGIARGYGFLIDGGTGDDIYDATTEGGIHHWQSQDIPAGSRGTNGGGFREGHGFLADGGGNDDYIGGSLAVNGGAAYGRATGVLLDVAGNDTYTAKQAPVNGGGESAVGLLYDNEGADFYADYSQRCYDCSDLPKGTIGAQVDRMSGTRSNASRVGSAEVLVVDDDAGTGAADCADASYQAIQPAVDAAEYGDTVKVCAGTYPGNVTIDTGNVTLRAAEQGQVVLDGGHKRRFGVALVAGKTTVTGFTATNFSKSYPTLGKRAAFLALGSRTTVKNNVIRNSSFGIIATGLYSDTALGETPIYNDEESTVISNNTLADTKLGIGVASTGNVRIARNTVRAPQIGISIQGADEVTVESNTLSGHARPATEEQRGISAVRSSEVTITDNTVTGFTAPNRKRPSGTISTGIGIEIRTPRRHGDEPTHSLRNNTMASNTYNLNVMSGRRSAYQHIEIGPTNTVNGKPVLYLHRATNVVIGPGSTDRLPNDSLAGVDTNLTNLPSIDDLETPGYVACVNCTNVTVRNLELAHNGQGVLIARSSGMSLVNVTVHDTLRGISVLGSPSNTVVTQSTVKESFKGIVVQHNCADQGDLMPVIDSPVGHIFGNDKESCAIPSVHLANNTIKQTGLLVDRHHLSGRGQGIHVAGTGVMVSGNTIMDGLGTGIAMRHASPGATSPSSGPIGSAITLLPDGGPDPAVNNTPNPIANSAVIDNAIANFSSVGLSMKRNHGALVRGNSVSKVGLGFFNARNNGLTYRTNSVTNATMGMFMLSSETDLTARNNSFRDVRWGLDAQFLYLGASGSHDFGTSNTVNGERILWLNDAVNRSIDAADVNMVVCVNCVDVTIQDMTISDNGHGIVFWDSESSRVTNVTVEDTLRTGVLIRGGQNVTVQNTTIIDSTLPIFTMPSPDTQRDGRRHIGRFAPTNPPASTGLLSQTLGSVRIVNNRVMVDDASWTTDQAFQSIHGPPHITRPEIWGHFGIFLFNPTTATVTGNEVTGNRWGIFHTRGELSELRIENNTVRHPREPRGRGRFGSNPHMGGPMGQMLGIRVTASDRSNGSIVVRNNTLRAGTTPIGTQKYLYGITIEGKEVPATTIADNRIGGYQQSLRIAVGSNHSTVSVRRNRLNGAKSASVFLTGPTPGEAVEIHQNLLNPLRFGYGVKSSTQDRSGDHMEEGGGASATHGQPVNATCNRWAAPSGPGTRRMTLVDPVTGEPADGNGSVVSQGHMHGESNVHFHPWLGDSPRLTCAEMNVGTATPTPIPTPTRTPWPTSGAGDGTGPGPGDGQGQGQGDGTGPGKATAEGGGEGTSTAMVRVPATATPTETPPSTATPEIVPGFGVAVWLVALLLLVAGLAVRRRD